MASVIPRFVPLKLGNLNPRPSSKDVEVTDVRPRYVIDEETKKPTSQLEGYALDFISLRSSIQTVKLPLTEEISSKIALIQDALKADSVVMVNFGNTFRARFYAMRRGDELIQGVTANAEILEITSIEAASDLEDFDEIIE